METSETPVLDRRHFDRHVERTCRRYYKGPLGRPSLAPGVYFRMPRIGYFEGLDRERGIVPPRGGAVYSVVLPRRLL